MDANSNSSASNERRPIKNKSKGDDDEVVYMGTFLGGKEPCWPGYRYLPSLNKLRLKRIGPPPTSPRKRTEIAKKAHEEKVLNLGIRIRVHVQLFILLNTLTYTWILSPQFANLNLYPYLFP